MRTTVTVHVGSHLSSTPSVASPLEAWREVVSMFQAPVRIAVPSTDGVATVTVTIKGRDVLAYLALFEDVEAGNAAAAAKMSRRFRRRTRSGRSMTGADLRATLTSEKATQLRLDHALTAFFQKLFLATTLAYPGACDLGTASTAEQSSHGSRGLHVDPIAFAVTSALDRGWPKLRRLPFMQAWEWLGAVEFDQTVVATKPVAKALITLLNVASSDADPAYGLLQIAGVFEALFAEHGQSIGRVVQRRIESILGAPPSHRTWFTKIYDARSRIAHGSDAIVRRGGLFLELPATQDHISRAWPSLDQLIAVHVALLQELVLRRASAFQFSETVDYL